MNNVKVFVLMAGLTALFVAIGGYSADRAGCSWPCCSPAR